MPAKKSTTVGDIAASETLVPVEKYLESGMHIGTKFKKGDMDKFIYKTRPDGLHVLNITMLDTRIRVAAHFLSEYDPKDVLVVAGRIYAQKPAATFAKEIGAKIPPVDRQAIKEAKAVKIPVVALCDVNNLLKNIDLAVAMNNKGKKALALFFYLLTREYLKVKGNVKKDTDFKLKVEDFESKAELPDTEE
jgi:small subunit ribosomal protein S2